MKKIYAHYRVKNYGTNKVYHGGGVTVYGEWNCDTGELRAIGAACMPDDNYCYARGRAIAEGRFKKYGNNEDKTPYTINVPYVSIAKTERDVHYRLGTVAATLAHRIHRKLPTGSMMVVLRYYRSTKRFTR